MAGVFSVLTLVAVRLHHLTGAGVFEAFMVLRRAESAGYNNRVVGQVFSPAVSMILLLKTVFFSLAVSLIPMASSLYDERPICRYKVTFQGGA
jgi:phospholipid/cholesterol/gamma-HCH transport system permease protein